MRTVITQLGALLLVTLATGCTSQSSTSPATQPGGSLAKAEKPQRSGPAAAAQDVGNGFTNFFSGIGNSLGELADRISGNNASRYAQLLESDNADQRRAGINWLVEKDYGKRPPYTTRFEQIARSDSDPLVRATAIRALNVSRDKAAADIFLAALTDPNLQVRLEGAKALLRVPNPDATGPLLQLLNRPDEDKDVRIAAADALRHYKTLEVARTLVSQLSNRDFGLAWQARRSLKFLTGRDLRYDEGAWLAYLTGPEKPFG